MKPCCKKELEELKREIYEIGSRKCGWLPMYNVCDSIDIDKLIELINKKLKEQKG